MARISLALATLLWPGLALAHEPARADYIANEAILVTQGDTKVLFDPLPLTGFGTYPDVPFDIREKILLGQAPYDGVDAVFVSHAHRDHFDAGAMNALMSAREDIQLIAPAQAVDMMREDSLWQEAFENRIRPITLGFGDNPVSIELAGIKASAVRIPHAGWPGRANVENIVYRVSLSESATVMHMGDADTNPGHYAPFDAHWQAQATDMNFPPYWFLLSPEGQTLATTTVNAEKAVGIHVPLRVPIDLIQSGQDYFSETGDHRIISAPATPCQPVNYQFTDYTVCKFSAQDDIRLFWGPGDGTPFASFSKLESHLAGQNQSLRFAMNAGMYHADRRPVGLYRENGQETTGLQTKASSGNFGLLPNGVFYRDGDTYGVMETLTYDAAGLSPEFATQSGPMLVIDGALHPKFRTGSDSRKIRNGVGISTDGQSLYFVKSEQPVNFYGFGELFQKHLKTPNALYLDGVVSRLYDPGNNRSDPGMPMGPMIGVVE